MRLISVVLGTESARSRAAETRSLLNYGFRFFETAELIAAGRELIKPEIWMGLGDYVSVGLIDSVTLTLPRGERRNVEQTLTVDEPLTAPVKIGDTVGTIRLTLDGSVLYEGPLQSLEDIDEAGFFARLWDRILMWIDSLLSPAESDSL
jgi:D-alanyl-D-alanine carboxypeptidase (penicillin-binding protein 5/6)